MKRFPRRLASWPERRRFVVSGELSVRQQTIGWRDQIVNAAGTGSRREGDSDRVPTSARPENGIPAEIKLRFGQNVRTRTPPVRWILACLAAYSCAGQNLCGSSARGVWARLTSRG